MGERTRGARPAGVRPPDPHPGGAKPPDIPPELVPKHVALVMDGDKLLGLLTPENLSEFLLLRQISRMRDKGHGS